MVVKRKLIALGYKTDSIDFSDNDQVRQLVTWLEINKIKQCGNKYRENLLNTQSTSWEESFSSYKTDLKCPIKSENIEAILDWILGYAIHLEYSLSAARFNKLDASSKITNSSSVTNDNPLDNIDFTSKEFGDGIVNIAALLKLTPHPDTMVTLEACSKLIKKRLSIDVQSNPAEHIITGTPFPYQSADLGFDMGDSVLNQSAKLLRLLYIQDLRNLQTSANECIVAVQAVTANPKTDTKLGKVGR